MQDNIDELDLPLSFFIQHRFKLTNLDTIIRTIGPEATQRLVAVLGGIQLDIPTQSDVSNAFRDYDIMRMYLEGETQEAIAQKYNLNQSWICRKIAELEPEFRKLAERRCYLLRRQDELQGT